MDSDDIKTNCNYSLKLELAIEFVRQSVVDFQKAVDCSKNNVEFGDCPNGL